MADVKIDRLKLRISGVTEEEARRMAQLIAEGLAGASLPAGVCRADTLSASALEPPDRSDLRPAIDQAIADVVGQLERML